ncbi:hypothetical protein PG997_014723 [Apiospora hydei]|uniref:Aminoglycoside phosphotransferase domain-containing protein n=1 Tax=Apiospora hydei TaxID=1337664 RepID=A0ABR1UUM1_9PEZI
MSVDIAKEMPANPRDWTGGIESYLEEHQIVCEKVTPLTSGLSSWVWRLDGLSDGRYREGEPAILKCAEGMAKLAPVPLAADRLQLEIKALKSRAVAEACRQEPSVRVPRVLQETQRGYLMTWGGEMDLRVAYKEGKLMDPAAVGARLGKWLACLHLAGTDRDEWNTRNSDVDTFIAPGGLEEQAIRTALGTEGSSVQEIDHVIDVLRQPAPVQTLTPWDFRPMNTLLKFKEPGAVPELTIVDWEFSHYGDPAYDLRLWAAEAMVLEAKFGKGKENSGSLLSSCLAAYRLGTGDAIVDDKFVCKTAIALGAFLLLFMPAPFWDCVEEDREPWVKLALQYIKAGAETDMGWLLQSSLGPLLMKP